MHTKYVNFAQKKNLQVEDTPQLMCQIYSLDCCFHSD